MNIKIVNQTILIDPPGHFADIVADRLTFENPKYIENEAQGRWNGETPQFLSFYEQFLDRNSRVNIAIPRGYTRQLIGLCRRHNVSYQIDDLRRVLPQIEFTFKGSLRPFQAQAVDDTLTRDFGTLSAPTGSGKTVQALFIIAQRKQPALIVVHTKELLNQWIDRIETFLGIPADEVGVIGNGQKRIGQKITVALVQSLYKVADQVAPHIGHLIVDECHRCPSRTFMEAVSAFDCQYMLGLSATPWRRDRLSKLIFWYVGDVIHEVEKEGLLHTGDIVPAEVITRKTNFTSDYDPSVQYSEMLRELTENYKRNLLITQDVISASNNGSGICLVLSDRKAHCEMLRHLLQVHGVHSELLTGDVPGREREEIVKRLNVGQVKVLVATGQLIGEGFDLKELSTLFLTTPIKFDGRVTQYLGRVLRPAPGKEKAIVYDYIDVNIGVLVASAKSRDRVFRELKG